MTEANGIHISTSDMDTAVTGFRTASTETKNNVELMRQELAKYANNPDKFQGPAADEFRRLHREISDDLDIITAETDKLSGIVEQANTEFVRETNNAASELSGGKSGGNQPAGGLIRGGLIK